MDHKLQFAKDSEYDVVRQFEREIAHFAGAEYGVAVDSCTAALFLCLQWIYNIDLQHDNNPKYQPNVSIPKRTYPSVPMEIIHAGFEVAFRDEDWKGVYQLKPFEVYDSAKRFTRDMYIPNSLYCLSFHYKKHLPIGRGGMILLNDQGVASWLRQARYMGRHEGVPLSEDTFSMCGWNLYMDPPRAARGLTLFHLMDEVNPDLEEEYPDLSKQEIFQ